MNRKMLSLCLQMCSEHCNRKACCSFKVPIVLFYYKGSWQRLVTLLFYPNACNTLKSLYNVPKFTLIFEICMLISCGYCAKVISFINVQRLIEFVRNYNNGKIFYRFLTLIHLNYGLRIELRRLAAFSDIPTSRVRSESDTFENC